VTLYLDTSASMKLVIAEAGSQELRAHLAERPRTPRAASSLVRTELRRAVSRTAPELLPIVERLLGALALVCLDDDLLDTAGRLGPQVLRSLDAVHLAGALRVAPLTALVTYDARMQHAAASLGLPVVAPGD
jgi:uncharacterized protein